MSDQVFQLIPEELFEDACESTTMKNSPMIKKYVDKCRKVVSAVISSKRNPIFDYVDVSRSKNVVFSQAVILIDARPNPDFVLCGLCNSILNSKGLYLLQNIEYEGTVSWEVVSEADVPNLLASNKYVLNCLDQIYDTHHI